MLLDSDHELPAGTGSAPVPDASLGDLLERAAWPAATGLEITGFAARARDHALFSELDTSAKLVVFTQHHVFAVWDYMALLHSVRQGLGAGEVHWTPPIDSRSSRLIYEILLEEEAGPSLAGTPLSHFEMYLQAMRALGGSLDGIMGFMAELRAGARPEEVIDKYAPLSSALFVRHTLVVARASLPERIAALAVARERLIPTMFPVLERSVAPLAGTADLAPFRYYLERHIQVDGEEHGPATAELVERHARGDARAAEAARRALEARVALWDGILEAL